MDGSDAPTRSDPPSADDAAADKPAPPLAPFTEYTAEDAAWLQSQRHAKMLDARIRIIGVAHRVDGKPAVLACYPLRVTGQATASEGTHASRREIRGGSKRKWQDDAPAPWPNFLWLCEPTLTLRAGRLEHLGLVQQFQEEVGTNATFAAELAAAHKAYGDARWAALTDADREYCESRHTSFPAVLRDTGVGGLRFASQVKCLHAHLAHTLAGGDNPVGRRVVEMLKEGRDAEVCTSATTTNTNTSAPSDADAVADGV